METMYTDLYRDFLVCTASRNDFQFISCHVNVEKSDVYIRYTDKYTGTPIVL